MNLVTNEIHFVLECLCQKGGGIQAIFMYYWMTLGNIHVLWATSGQHSCIATEVFMPYWNFEYTTDITLHCGKVVGCMGQGPVTEVTHLRLNQPTIPPVFCNKKSWRWGQGTRLHWDRVH